jgi:hypothetical protein
MSGLTADDCDGALQYLEETCDSISAAKAELERSAILAKRARKRIFLTAEGSSVAQREATAEVHPDVVAADERHVEAIGAFEALKAKRELCVIRAEVYRTQEASRRQVR